MTQARRSSLGRLAGSVALIFLGVAAGAAQEPRGLEAGVQGMVALADPVFAGGGAAAALRTGGRSRVALAMVPGNRDGRFAFRGELTAHFLLDPGRRHGVSPYAVGGIAGVIGRSDNAFVVAGLGLEAAPGGRSGWWIEGGAGGGARLAVGWRWRWLRWRSPRPP
ncbi:MAG TPA: hypothetical protein VH879_01390 [Gemmatimonadales bacterium]